MDPIQLLKELQDRRFQINECKKTIQLLKDEISILNEELYEKCKHKWERVSDYADDDLCKHSCKYCHLWQNKFCNE